MYLLRKFKVGLRRGVVAPNKAMVFRCDEAYGTFAAVHTIFLHISKPYLIFSQYHRDCFCLFFFLFLEKAANVCYQEFDVPGYFPVELKQYLPNIVYSHDIERSAANQRAHRFVRYKAYCMCKKDRHG